VTCHELQPHLRAFALGGAGDPLSARIAAHVQTCAACARDLEDLKAVAPFYRFTEPPARSPEFWRRFVSDVQVLVEASGRKQATPVRRTSRWFVRHAWAAGLSCAFCLAAAFWGLQSEWTTGNGQAMELSGAIEFYLEQHDEAVAGQVLVEAFPVHGADEFVRVVGMGGHTQ
jgi:hypothetical protein